MQGAKAFLFELQAFEGRFQTHRGGNPLGLLLVARRRSPRAG